MPWGALIAAVGSYASSESQKKSAKNQSKAEIEAQKELLEQKRKYDLEDRAYRQQAVAGWQKFYNPEYSQPMQPQTQLYDPNTQQPIIKQPI